MDNQHRKISGYRELTSDEIELMNLVKEHARRVGELVEILRAAQDLDQRWISEGRTDLQKGFMSLTRGIAQPTTF